MNDINDVLKNIDTWVELAIVDPFEFERKKSDILKLISNIITNILSSYALDDMILYKQDIDYWNNYYRRFVLSIKNNDALCFVDLLKYELKKSLELYIELMDL